MRETLLHLSDTPLHEKREWRSDGIVVLTAEVTLPRCEGKGRAARRFERYYRRYASAYFSYCAGELYPRAVASMHEAMARSAPWERPRAVLDYTVTLTRDGLLSLYTEGHETNLAPPLVLRRAETWDLREGLLCEAADFFPRGTPLRRLLTLTARETAARTAPAAYGGDGRARLRRALSLRNFYLAPDGFHWFYPMYTLDSACIPDFTLREGAHGFALPPEEREREEQRKIKES